MTTNKQVLYCDDCKVSRLNHPMNYKPSMVIKNKFNFACCFCGKYKK